MYQLDRHEVIDKFGYDVYQRLVNSDFEPTSRLMYPGFEPPHHLGLNEWRGQSIVIDEDFGTTISVYCYLSDEDESNIDCYDFECNSEFYIE